MKSKVWYDAFIVFFCLFLKGGCSTLVDMLRCEGCSFIGTQEVWALLVGGLEQVKRFFWCCVKIHHRLIPPSNSLKVILTYRKFMLECLITSAENKWKRSSCSKEWRVTWSSYVCGRAVCQGLSTYPCTYIIHLSQNATGGNVILGMCASEYTEKMFVVTIFSVMKRSRNETINVGLITWTVVL